MIWTQKIPLGLWALFSLFLTFLWARGDMDGFSGLLIAVGWSLLYLALPLWIGLSVIRWMFRRQGAAGREYSR